MVKRSSSMAPLSITLFLLIIIIIAALQLEASVPMKTFHIVKEWKSWSDARQHCKKKFTDLASADYYTKDLLDEIVNNAYGGWSGLYRDRPGSAWKWTGERGDTPGDTNWQKEPENSHSCAYIWYNGKFQSQPCSSTYWFVCFSDNVILVKENKTWEEALEHCRAIGSTDPSQHNHYRKHQYDLVSLQSEDDHRYARDKIHEATTHEVWTALRFLAGRWLWVDGEPQRYQDLPQCPAWGQHCGTLPKDNSTTQWQTRDCMERRNFLCIKSTAG